MLVLGLAAAYRATLAPGVTWANGGGDSGDLITAAAVLGVAHPTGYPSYLLLARLFQAIPIGDLAYRTTLLSVAAALGAVLAAYALVRRLLGGRGHAATFGAASGALALGVSPLFWSQAVVAEVLTLNALCVVALLWFTVLDTRSAAEGTENVQRATCKEYGTLLSVVSEAESPGWRVRAVVAGLALGNHVTIALLVLAWMAVIAWRNGVRALLRRLPWLGAGLLVYLYVPLRAIARPALSWGDARNVEGLLWLLSGAPYRHMVFGIGAEELPTRAGEAARLLLEQFGVVGLALGLFGLLAGSPHHRRLVRLSAVIAGAYVLFALGYAVPEPSGYYLPVFVIFAVWIGVGAGRVIECKVQNAKYTLDKISWHFTLADGGMWGDTPHAPLLSRNCKAHKNPVSHLAPCALHLKVLVGIVIVVSLLWQVPGTMKRVDASDDRRAIVFAEAVLANVPPGAVVLTSTDLDTFPLWYAHIALGQRPDIAVVVEPLLDYAWYRAQLRHHEPQLQVPEEGDPIEGFLGANATVVMCRTDPLAAVPVACQ
jgi:hypothetical protein